MSSFYKEWLKRNNEENIKALTGVQPPSLPLASTSKQNTRTLRPSTSKQIQVEKEVQQPIDKPPETTLQQTDIVYENDKLKLIVEKGTFQRQKRFRLQDHLFYMKVQIKNEKDPIPFLKDLFEFLESALLHVMQNIKTFYNSRDENLAFLTLYQQPMITGLNSGVLI